MFCSVKFHFHSFLAPRELHFRGERVYLDHASATEWAAHQSALTDRVGLRDKDGVPNVALAANFYSDKTRISDNQDSHGLYLHLAGIDQDVVTKSSCRAMTVLTYLPILSGQEFERLNDSKKVRTINLLLLPCRQSHLQTLQI